MKAERTAWAEGMALEAGEIDALTSVAEESHRRAGDDRPDLPPGDVDSWPEILEHAGQSDLAACVRAIRAGQIRGELPAELQPTGFQPGTSAWRR